MNSSYDLDTPIFIPGASTDDNAQARRPYPQFQNVFLNFSGINSWYNSMQATLNKRFSRGFSILGAYTLSKSTDGGDTVGNTFTPGSYRDPRRRYLDYGPSDFDIRHVLSITYNWELPFPSHANSWLKRALGGWVWGGTLRALTGDPLTVSSPSDFDHFSGNGAWANYVGSSPYGDHTIRAAQAAGWLNGNAFCATNEVGPACNADPQAGVSYLALGNYRRGMARGPGKVFNDVTLAKRFPISERWGTLEFRAAAFNVFNHTVLNDPDVNIADKGAGFGQIFSAANPRHVQLSVRYVF